MRYGGADATLLPLSSFPAVVSAVETGLAGAGVLAIENSLEGAVGTTLDLLIHETELSIVAEVVLPIRHMLLARPETSLGEIKVLRSHPQTLGQCRRFIERVLPRAQTAASLSNTAAVEEMLEEQNSAAISTPRAAELYPVQILARDIQDRQINETRFVVLAPSDSPPTGDDKTSLAFSTSKAERPGALVALLNEFAKRSINLTKLESRPARRAARPLHFLVRSGRPPRGCPCCRGAARYGGAGRLRLKSLVRTLLIGMGNEIIGGQPKLPGLPAARFAWFA